MQVFADSRDFLSNLTDAKKFSLGDPRVICRILSDHLYSNKIGSIIRELSANALDAHREAGNESKPFKVHVPGAGEGLFAKNDAVFSIRDYGTGLPESGIYSLYTSYGSSSKREDSFQIGGFGIGSKSPFAYVGTFEVVSWHGGLKSQYVCFQDASGAPCVKKLSEEASAEPNGIEVKFSVPDSGDYDRFADECRFQYAWYKTKPVCNVPSPDLKPVYENEWGMCIPVDMLGSIRSRLPGDWYSRSCCRAIVNNSVYSLSELYNMREMTPDENLIPFSECICLLKVPGDQVDISASREELAFTDRTSSTVKKIAAKFVLRAGADIWKEMCSDADRSLFEAMWKWRKKHLNAGFLSHWVRSQGLGSNHGIPVHDSMTPDGVPLKASFLGSLMLSGVRAYEVSRRDDWHKLPTSVSKLTKGVTDPDTGEKKTAFQSKTIRMDYAFNDYLPEGASRYGWNLSLRGCPEFRLVFAPRKTMFKDIEAWMREEASKVFPGGIIHLYAVDEPEIRQKICEAYGRPDAERIECLDDLQSARTRGSRRGAANADKREKIKARMDSFDFWSHSQSPLDAVRKGIADKWYSMDEIKAFLDDGAIMIVTSGTEVSSAIPLTARSMMKIFDRVSAKGSIPRKWIVLNEASYKKWLSLGGRKIEDDDAFRTVEKFVASLGIGAADFRKWCFLNCHSSETMFSKINSTCRGDVLFKNREDTPVGEAWRIWSSTGKILKKHFIATDALSEALTAAAGSGGICSEETRTRLNEEMKAAVRFEEIVAWVKRNPVLNLLDGKWTSESNLDKVAKIVRQYVKWQ